MRPKPLVLTILDGFGLRAAAADNAIEQAETPNLDRWWATRPHAQLLTSGLAVGLPEGQMGNSEVGHLNLGAGRVVYQDYTRIGQAIEEGGFYRNAALNEGVAAALARGGAVHILGLLSPGGVHSHTDHLLAAVRLAQAAGAGRIWVHAFLDGRDTPPRSALTYLAGFEAGLRAQAAGAIASVCGRYYAMDRDQRWERVRRAYDLLTLGEGETAASARAAVEAAYGRGEDDEFVQPTVVVGADGRPLGLLADGDAVLVLNFRADRVRELSRACTEPDFAAFERRCCPQLAAWVCLTLYDASLTRVTVAFPPQSLEQLLGGELARHGLTQLRAAETEKYAHVTYFFNGGVETPFPGEERLLIPSPAVATYDLQPEMSAERLTDQVVERIGSGRHDVIILNYANADMVGHTGSLEAAVRAIATLDRCLGRLAEAVLAQGGELLITADHGNAEQMREASTGQPHTAHTTNSAPLLHVGRRWVGLRDGRLCDVAPTVLALLGLPQPEAMAGHSLLVGSIADVA